MTDNAHVSAPDDVGATAPTSHRASGPAKIGLPSQPWWRTALDSHRGVLLALSIAVSYTAIGVRALQADDWLVGVACLALATSTLVCVVGWLRPVHRFRRWAIASLVLLVAAPLVWSYVTR